MEKKRMYQTARIVAFYLCSLPQSVRKTLIDTYYPETDGERVMIKLKDGVFDILDKADELLAEYRIRQSAGIAK